MPKSMEDILVCIHHEPDQDEHTKLGRIAREALCSLVSKREGGNDISTSDRATTRHQGSKPATRCASGEMAARIPGPESRHSPPGIGRRPPRRRGNGLVASLHHFLLSILNFNDFTRARTQRRDRPSAFATFCSQPVRPS
jgi:hypothetical protein